MSNLIIGHTTDHSARIWVRANEKWPVAIIQVFYQSGMQSGETLKILTKPTEFFTYVFDVDELTDDTSYRVKLYFAKDINDDPEDWVRSAYTEGNFRTYKSTGSRCTFIFGSCNLHSLGWFEKPDRAWLQISKVAAQNEASFMLHCGDQIYADIPFKPAQNYQHYRDKYLDAWDDCTPAKKCLTELPHYMILDDHEITNNFSQDMDLRNRDPQALANFAMKVYWEFQHSHNPKTPQKPYQYDYRFNHGDVQFFVMDTRYYRITSDEDGNNQMIDQAQMKRLLKWLSSHDGEIKFVVTSVPFVGVVKKDKDDKWCSPAFQSQRDEILSHIHNNKITKVCFLTGDMHNSYLAKLTIQGENDNEPIRVHEIMSSPINQVTPNTTLKKRYATGNDTKTKWHLPNGAQVNSNIIASSFYGNHSNVTAVEVKNNNLIKYRVYRTSKKDTKPVKFGQFIP